LTILLDHNNSTTTTYNNSHDNDVPESVLDNSAATAATITKNNKWERELLSKKERFGDAARTLPQWKSTTIATTAAKERRRIDEVDGCAGDVAVVFDERLRQEQQQQQKQQRVNKVYDGVIFTDAEYTAGCIGPTSSKFHDCVLHAHNDWD
jgi:hypothetical protein